jgi:hypothetical protein
MLFVPVAVASSAGPIAAAIEIELRRGPVTMKVSAATLWLLHISTPPTWKPVLRLRWRTA